MTKTGLLIATLLTTTVPASAGTFELFGGYYASDDLLIEEGSALGLRGGLLLRGPWSAEVSLSRLEGNVDRESGFLLGPNGGTSVGHFKAEQTQLTFELSFVRKLGESGWSILGGPGWGYVENNFTQSFSGSPGTRFKTTEDLFSLHTGLTGRFRLSDHTYLRPDLRIRWSDDVDLRFADDSNNFDTEASIAIGWKF
ncbi:MAG: hypothetical protein SF066_19780 [Thermoanaerobaculia bacterium]|nr:hypothetical protein [Thermoanaerobaculia bacterium]